MDYMKGEAGTKKIEDRRDYNLDGCATRRSWKAKAV